MVIPTTSQPTTTLSPMNQKAGSNIPPEPPKSPVGNRKRSTDFIHLSKPGSVDEPLTGSTQQSQQQTQQQVQDLKKLLRSRILGA